MVSPQHIRTTHRSVLESITLDMEVIARLPVLAWKAFTAVRTALFRRFLSLKSCEMNLHILPLKVSRITGDPASIDNEDVAVHVSVLRVGKKQRRYGYFIRIRRSAQRHMVEHPLH
jgi:hypothetical protein